MPVPAYFKLSPRCLGVPNDVAPHTLHLCVGFQMRQTMKVLGCQAWDVGAVLTTDEEVLRLNRQVGAR